MYLYLNLIEFTAQKENIYISFCLYNFKMIINKTILIGLGIIVGIYLLYKLLFASDKFDEEYQQIYDKVLTSDEYKVKGQYDK